MMARHALLLAAAALLELGSVAGMIWHPKNPKNSMWDTWLYAQPGQDAVPKFYMNYLSECDGSCGGPPSADPGAVHAWWYEGPRLGPCVRPLVARCHPTYVVDQLRI